MDLRLSCIGRHGGLMTLCGLLLYSCRIHAECAKLEDGSVGAGLGSEFIVCLSISI